MAHELHVDAAGKASMAFVGETPWHNLGQKLTVDAPIKTWIKEAGFDWKIQSKAIHYHGKEVDGKPSDLILPGKRILTRSDNDFGLSIVSDAYKVVQPKEILEFFQDLVGVAGMKLSTAGVLFEGRKFWAMADTDNWGELNGNDKIKGSLLLSTSCDGSIATTAQFVATRVVCANTLRIALAEGGNKVAISHRKVFDPREVKEKLGLINESWETFMANIKRLNEREITLADAETMTEKFMKSITKSELAVKRESEKIIANFQHGMGNQGKTMWDLLNGMTETFQHGQKNVKSFDKQFWNNFYDHYAGVKDASYDFMVAESL